MYVPYKYIAKLSAHPGSPRFRPDTITELAADHTRLDYRYNHNIGAIRTSTPTPASRKISFAGHKISETVFGRLHFAGDILSQLICANMRH